MVSQEYIDNLPDVLLTGEVAKLFQRSGQTIKRWTKRGKIPSVKICRRGDRRYLKSNIIPIIDQRFLDGRF